MENRQLTEAAKVRSLINAHVRRAKTLRQIQSDKASKAKGANTRYLIATIFVATIVSVAGFGGVDQFAAMLPDQGARPWADFVYSMLVLLVLIITLLGIVGRFDERANRHYRSIEILTEFIRDWEDLLELATTPGNGLTTADVTEARLRYKGIIMTLPPNTDKEYERAKRKARSKQEEINNKSTSIHSSGYAGNDQLRLRGAPAPADYERALISQMTENEYKRKVLQLVEKELGAKAWITGGFVRDAVWDKLHSYGLATALEDIDIVYFDPDDLSESSERQLSERLALKFPNVKWSVKNEARMHVAAGDDPYMSLDDAISRFPETATAVAVQLNKGVLRVLAPLGLADLFQLSLRANPRANRGAFVRRLKEKDWLTRWPLLTFEEDDSAIAGAGPQSAPANPNQ